MSCVFWAVDEMRHGRVSSKTQTGPMWPHFGFEAAKASLLLFLLECLLAALRCSGATKWSGDAVLPFCLIMVNSRAAAESTVTHSSKRLAPPR